MDIEQEREKFKLGVENQAKIDKYMDNILSIMAAEDVQPVALIGVDKVYVSNLGFQRPEIRYRGLLQLL